MIDLQLLSRRQSSDEKDRAGKISLSKQRCEDPSVVSINSVICHHGITLTATGNAKEWTGGICRIIFAARRRRRGVSIEDIGHLRNYRSEPAHVSTGRRWRAAGINGQRLHEAGDILGRRADQLPFSRTRKRIARGFNSQYLKFLCAAGDALQQLVH